MQGIPVSPSIATQAMNNHIAQETLHIADLVSPDEHSKFVRKDVEVFAFGPVELFIEVVVEERRRALFNGHIRLSRVV